jgi:hypothetical protein
MSAPFAGMSMPELDLTMRALALVALLMYLLPRVIGGRVGALLPRVAAAILAVGFVLALVQTFFWFSR